MDMGWWVNCRFVFSRVEDDGGKYMVWTDHFKICALL